MQLAFGAGLRTHLQVGKDGLTTANELGFGQARGLHGPIQNGLVCLALTLACHDVRGLVQRVVELHGELLALVAVPRLRVVQFRRANLLELELRGLLGDVHFLPLLSLDQPVTRLPGCLRTLFSSSQHVIYSLGREVRISMHQTLTGLVQRSTGSGVQHEAQGNLGVGHRAFTSSSNTRSEGTGIRPTDDAASLLGHHAQPLCARRIAQPPRPRHIAQPQRGRDEQPHRVGKRGGEAHNRMVAHHDCGFASVGDLIHRVLRGLHTTAHVEEVFTLVFGQHERCVLKVLVLVDRGVVIERGATQPLDEAGRVPCVDGSTDAHQNAGVFPLCAGVTGLAGFREAPVALHRFIGDGNAGAIGLSSGPTQQGGVGHSGNGGVHRRPEGASDFAVRLEGLLRYHHGRQFSCIRRGRHSLSFQ